MSNAKERITTAQWILERNLAWIAAADVKVEIRAQVGRATRQQRDAKVAELTALMVQLKTLRAERDAALADVAKLASINETLRQEVATQRAAASGNVFVLPPRGSV
jgi:uncharacterized coiled-coil DUF342 family protein